MKENVKNTTKALYTMCICLIVVMGVLFLGNSLTKGTYSAAVTPELNTPLATDTEYCLNGATPSNGKCGCEDGYILQEEFGICCPKGSTWATGSGMCIITGQWGGGYEKPGIGDYNCASYDKTVCQKKGLTYTNGKCIWKCGEPSKPQISAKTCAAGKYLINKECTASVPEETKETTFTAKFNPNGGNGSIVSRTCTTGNTQCNVTSAPAPSRSGYTFNGWSATTGCSSSIGAGVNVILTTDKTYYACWSKNSTSGAGCYNVGSAQGNHYVWLDEAPSHGTLVADSYCESKDNKKYTYKFYNKDGSVSLGVKTCIVNQSTGSCTTAITPPSCSGQWSGQKNCPTNSVKVGPNFFGNKDDSGNFYNLIGDSSWYCCDGDSTGEDGGDIPDPIPNPPTTPSTSSNPPSSSTVTENPKTGSIAIFMVWVIAIGTLIYSIAYFKQSKFE